MDEPESAALERYIRAEAISLVSSRIAMVEVTRTVRMANPALATEADALLSSCFLVEVGVSVLRRASEFASAQLRTLDAIHLASALAVELDEILVYDRRLAEAAETAGLTVSAPTR